MNALKRRQQNVKTVKKVPQAQESYQEETGAPVAAAAPVATKLSEKSKEKK